MIAALKKFYQKHIFLSSILMIFIVVLIAYGQTLLMYFWQDDFALIFKLQHQSEPMGSFGSGIIGEGPYKYLVAPYALFYPLFKTEPFGYFLVGFLSYLVVVYTFYLFAKSLLEDKKSAVISSLIFASGYIGSDIMFRIINSWQTNVGLILALLALTFYTKSIKLASKKITNYLISLILFWAAVEFVFVRSHSLVLPFLIIDILLFFSNFQFKKISSLIIRQLPFWYLFYTRYLLSVPAGSSSFSQLTKSLLQGKFEILTGLLGTIGNAFVPDYYQSLVISIFPSKFNFVFFSIFLALGLGLLWIQKAKFRFKISLLIFFIVSFLLNKYFSSLNLYWYRDSHSIVAGAIGLYVSVITLVTAIVGWAKNKTLIIGLVIGYVILGSQIFGYFIQYPNTIFTTTHRYLSYSSIGYGLYFGSLVSLLWKKKNLGVIILCLLITSNLVLGYSYQNRLVEQRSKSTRKFYQDLLTYTPNINQGAIFYFDIKNDSLRQTQFRDFFSVGSMPDSTALAMWYGIDRDQIRLTTDYEEFLFLVSESNNLDNIYTYFYGDNGLVDTTQATRNALIGVDRQAQAPTLTEYVLTTNVNIDIDNCSNSQLPESYVKYLTYLQARRAYYSSVSVKSLSQWRGEEVSRVIDQETNTNWRGHRIYWNEKKDEKLTLDLGSVKNINKLVWTNTTNTLTPTKFNIQVSIKGNDWSRVKDVNSKERSAGEVVVEEFDWQRARYVLLDFESTMSDDSPAISEIEVLGLELASKDIVAASKFISGNMKFSEENNCLNALLLQKFAPYLNLVLDVKTDKGISSTKVNLQGIGQRSYRIMIRPGGTKVQDLKLFVPAFSKELSVTVNESRSLSFDEIQARGIIKTFSKN